MLWNFLDRDAAVLAIYDAMRESDMTAKSMAGQVASYMAQYAKRPVDWRPRAKDLRVADYGSG